MREMPPVFLADLHDLGWLHISSIYIGLGPQPVLGLRKLKHMFNLLSPYLLA